MAAALWIEGASGICWRIAAVSGAAPERSPLVSATRAHLSSGAALACVLAPRLWHGYRARSLAQEVSTSSPLRTTAYTDIISWEFGTARRGLQSCLHCYKIISLVHIQVR